MFTPKLADLEKIWDVAPRPYKPMITATAESLPLVKGFEARQEKKLLRADVTTSAKYICDWVRPGEESWGLIMTELQDEPFDYLLVSDLWLREPLQGQGVMSELIRKGYPYWRKRIDYWVVPQWNDASRVLFEHVGFRESDLLPGKYTETSLIADLKDPDGPMAEWYSTKEPSEEDPTG